MDQHEQQDGNPNDAEFYYNLPDLSNILGGNQPDTDLDALLERLPLCDSVELIDELTEDICHLNLDPKGPNLQWILTKLLNVPTPELVRFYSRMVAALTPRIEPKTWVGDSLLTWFYKMLKNKEDEMKTEKMLNIKFIGELCKFAIVPHHQVCEVFGLLIDNCTADNLELFGLLNETCGDFLLRSPSPGDEIAEKMKRLVASFEIAKKEEDDKREERERTDRLKQKRETRRILNKERKSQQREENLKREEERLKKEREEKERKREEKERKRKEREDKKRDEEEERAREKERGDKKREEEKDMARKEKAEKKALKKALKKAEEAAKQREDEEAAKQREDEEAAKQRADEEAAKQRVAEEAGNDENIANLLKERLQLFEELASLEEEEKELDRVDNLTSEHEELIERLKVFLSIN